MAPEICDSRRCSSVCQQSTWHSATMLMRTRFWYKRINTLNLQSYVPTGIEISARKMHDTSWWPWAGYLHLCASVTKRYNLVLGVGQIISLAGGK